MSEESTRISSLFSQISKKYDLANRIISFGLDRGWRRQLIEMACPQGDHVVLDLCTGTGDLVIEIARAQKGARIIGIDLSREMLLEAQRKLAKESFETHALLIEGDALRLPFESMSFDIVTMAFGLRNLTNLSSGLDEMARVLRLGGRLAILEFSIPSNFLWRPIYLFYLKHLLPRVGGLITGSRAAYQYLHDSVAAFPEPIEILAEMTRAGFSKLSAQKLLGGVAMLYLGERANFLAENQDVLLRA